MNSSVKKRIDTLIVEKGMVKSRQRAKTLIMAGKVFVNEVMVDKPGTLVIQNATIKVKQDDNPYVSRGGLKLERALKTLPVSVQDAVCMDIGASTGGFTDCLLQHGAKKVFAVDVGYGQLDWSLRQDNRVEVIERTNIRHLDFDTINCTMDVITADTSFISLKVVLPAAEKFMHHNTLILALIKPQFEAGKQFIQKGGVVKNPEVRTAVIDDIKVFFTERGYLVNQVIASPITGPKGNQEYIISLNFRKNIK